MSLPNKTDAGKREASRVVRDDWVDLVAQVFNGGLGAEPRITAVLDFYEGAKR
jgi:hypothetical protein